MPETNKREAHGHKREAGSEVRVVVEVDGNPVGFLELDVARGTGHRSNGSIGRDLTRFFVPPSSSDSFPDWSRIFIEHLAMKS